MQSLNTKIAHIKRLLKRLDDEDARVKDLVLAGTLTPEQGEIAHQVVSRERDRLSAELRNMSEGAGDSGSTTKLTPEF